MLSTTHAIFHRLQDDLRHSLTNLPNSAPAYLKTALVKAHRKLSNYYCPISINLSPLCDCDAPDEIFILSPCQEGCDKVPISSDGANFGKNCPIQDICDKLPVHQAAL
jgi:hypothetical protein